MTTKTITTSRSLRFAFALVVAGSLVAAFAGARVVEAHADYDRSLPAAGSVVPAAGAVEIWFTQELFRRAGANTISVEGPDGRVEDQDAVIDAADRTHLTVALAAGLRPGEYRVTWTSLSAIDGDDAEGDFSFTIDPAAPEPTPAGSEATPVTDGTAGSTAVPPASEIVDDGSSFPTWVIVAAGAIVASAALGAWALLRGEPEAAEG